MRKSRRSSIVAAVYSVILLCFLLVFGAVSASAALNVNTDKSSYNLGDQIVVNYDFSRDQDFSGLLKLSLFCTNYGLDFYTLPTNLNAGQKQEVSVPALSIASTMVGRCYVAANATSFDQSVNEGSTSNFFNVTNLMSVALLTDKELYLPSQSVEVSGSVGKSHALPASVVMSFLGTNYASVVANNTFSYSIRLPKDVKSGRQTLSFSVNDSYGNSGSASVDFTVQAVPTRIVDMLSSQSVKPDEVFYASVLIYDQAGDLISSPITLKSTDSAGNVVFSISNYTGTDVALAFPTGQAPGTYTLTSSGEGLTGKSSLLVEEVESVAVVFNNGTVTINNIGNVNYAGKFNITLSGKKMYMVTEDVDMKPGQAFVVDLSKAVSSGEYNISFPTVANASPVEKVYVEDKRSVVKKTSDFLGITGTNVKVIAPESGKLQANRMPLLLLFIFVIIVLLVFLSLRKKGRGESFGRSSHSMEGGSGGSEKSVQQPVKQQMADDEDSRVRRIIEEKRRQQLQRQPLQPKTLDRNSPESKKFLRDMMKEKQFR